MTDQRPCPECGTLNPADAMVCSNCGASLMRTLSLQLAEIDERDPTFRILPAQGDPYTAHLGKRVMTLGREEGQDIRIDSAGVAVRHARIMSEGGSYRLFDITTGQGVLINGQPVDSALLHDGDVIRLQDAKGVGVTIAYSNPVERALGGTASIGRLYQFDKFPFMIGRAPDSSVKLDALAVSWHHAQIDVQGNHHIITDLKSANGTFVNERRVTNPTRLQAEDVIRIDKVLLVYKTQGLQRLASVQQFQIDGRELEMTYREGFLGRQIKNTLRGVTLSIRPNEFVAVIGGSGSGKSTLLRALNGAARASGGQILINGDNFYANYTMYQPIIGYVPQADIVQNDLTVQQALTFGARLRFPNEPAEAREQRVARVIDDLELEDYARQLIRSLSGGQKKRVNIALELMAEPGLLFMDEPSSGLDPGLDKELMDILRKLADRGHVVVIVTHTTLNIEKCDMLTVIARGNLAYFGPPKEALSFFGVRSYPELYNRVFEPIDRTQKVSINEAARQWAERYKASPIYAKYVTGRLIPPTDKKESTETVLSNKRLAGRRRGTFVQQTQVLAERTFTLALHNARTLAALLLVLPLIGLFLALINFDTLFGTRGQMLVSRGNDTTLAAEVLDKLPLNPVATNEVGSSPQQTKPPSAVSAVRGLATFAPANDAQRLLFMMSLAVALLGIFASAYTIVEEKSLFLRERMVNLRISPYLASKLIVYGGLALISCLLLLITVSFGVRLPDHGLITWGPLELFITLSLTAFAGVSLGLLISALTGKIDAATYAVLGVLFVQILFPGVLFKMEGPLRPLSMLTVTRWSLEALGGTADLNARNSEGRIVVVSAATDKKGNVLPDAPPSKRIFPSPSALNVDYPMEASGLLLCWGVLVLFTLIFVAGASRALNRSESF